MMKILNILFCNFILAALLQGSLFAETEKVSSTMLIERASDFDGKRVEYGGEILTAVMKRGPFSWVTVRDGSNAIGVWCPAELSDKINVVGGYKFRGDLAAVSGIFHRACEEHAGELDIHADGINIFERGHGIKEVVNIENLRMATALFFALLVGTIVFKRRL